MIKKSRLLFRVGGCRFSSALISDNQAISAQLGWRLAGWLELSFAIIPSCCELGAAQPQLVLTVNYRHILMLALLPFHPWYSVTNLALWHVGPALPPCSKLSYYRVSLRAVRFSCVFKTSIRRLGCRFLTRGSFKAVVVVVVVHAYGLNQHYAAFFSAECLKMSCKDCCVPQTL